MRRFFRFFLFWMGWMSAFTATLHAQDDYAPDTLRTEFPMPAERNGLAANLTPLAVVAMSGFPINPRWGLYYYRTVKPYKNIRIQANFESLARYDDQRLDAPVSWSDSTIVYQFESRQYINADLRLGMEYFKPGERFTMVYGFDAFVGFARRFDASFTRPYAYDLGTDSWVPSSLIPQENNEATVDLVYVGADFSIAQRVQVRPNAFLTLQWTPELAWYTVISERYANPADRSVRSFDGLQFRLRGIELYFHQRF